MIAAVITPALRAALVLAAEGHKCLPCAHKKRPTMPHGHLDAQDQPASVRDLLVKYPQEPDGPRPLPTQCQKLTTAYPTFGVTRGSTG
jgi:hypothetical protein